ncbi:MAG: hypothetical protein QXX25_08740 [Thermofilaceae archaeon]
MLGVDRRGVSYALKISAEDFHELTSEDDPRFTLSLLKISAECSLEREVLERVMQLNHTCIVGFYRALEATVYRPSALVFEYCEGVRLGISYSVGY